MVYRFLTSLVVFTTGRTLAHGLLATPDEYWVAKRGASNAWFSTVPADATNIYLTAASNATVSVFARNALAIMK